MALIAFVAAPFRQLRRYRRILMRTSLIELRSLYAGSSLGLLWVAVGPTVLLLLYAVMFGVVLRVKPADLSPAQYLMYMCSGLVALLAFSGSLHAGATSVSKNRQVLLNTVFPAELLPVRAVLIASAIMPVGLVVVVAIDGFITGFGWPLLLVPVVVALQLMFSIGLAWLLCLLTLALRDTPMLLQYISMALLFVSPIGYTPDMTPPAVKVLMYANPLFYYINALQCLIVFDRLPSVEVMAISVLLSALTFGFGFWVFQRAKQTFLDYA